ncbi:MAG TPA: MarR family transcriptional regulator [Patescibacteria group bacterium]|nr:MarR family transcriptional regulator [Patescibacteria group bacterium]
MNYLLQESDNITVIRNTFKIFMRSLGIIEGKKAFCYDCTYAQCHVIWETAQKQNISVNELSSRLNVSKSAISRTVDDLVNKGYLQRASNPRDRRYVEIQLTESGEKTYQEIQQTSHRYFEAIIEAIPEEKRQSSLEGILLFSRALQAVFSQEKTTKGSLTE